MLICSIDTWKDISSFWQGAPCSLEARLLYQWGSPRLPGHLQRLLLGDATRGLSPGVTQTAEEAGGVRGCITADEQISQGLGLLLGQSPGDEFQLLFFS